MFCPTALTRRRLRQSVLNSIRIMARSNSEAAASRFESLTTEYQICRRKLESKCEALLILSRELDQCRSERDQFKLMAEQLRDRYQMVKRQLTGDTPMSSPHVEVDPKTYSDIQTQSLARMLFDTKEANKSLKFEVEDLKQKLQDAEGDIKLLREQIARSRVGTTDEGMNTRHFPAHERENLVKQLEVGREEYVQLERDLQQVLDEKEELVTERDAYRTKYERLNTELNYILGGDEKRIVDIDALSMENKFLQERLKQMEEEKTIAMATVTKYKSILEKKKTKGILKLGQSRSGGLVITQKQVQQIMQSRSSITPTPQALADLQGLCGALLDTINDKNLALSHQRKTNKLLGNRVSELEKKLKTLEMSGLWSVSGNFQNLEKLKAECEEIKTLVPRKFSHSTDTSEPPHNASDLDSDLSSATNSVTASPLHQRQTLNQLSMLDLEELDLLPTKEEVVKGEGNTNAGATSGADSNAVGNCDMSSPGIDTAVGISDIEDGSTGSDISRVVLTEAMLKSLLGGQKSKGGASGSECDISHSDEEDNKWLKVHDEMDSEDREAAIQRCLRQDSDDEEEAYSCYNFYGDEDEDEDDEVNEEFKSLLEKVTQKLLQRSQHQQHQHEHAQENQQTQPHQQQKPAPKERNVYIRDDFDYYLPVQNDILCESTVLPSDDSQMLFPEPSSFPSGCDIKNSDSKALIKQDSKDMFVMLGASDPDHCAESDDKHNLKDKIIKSFSSDTEEKGQGDKISKNTSHKLSTSCSDTEDREHGAQPDDKCNLKDKIIENISDKLAASSSDTEKGQGDETSKNTSHKFSTPSSDTGDKGQGDKVSNTSHKLSTASSDFEDKGQGDEISKNTSHKFSTSNPDTGDKGQGDKISKNTSHKFSTSTSDLEDKEQEDETDQETSATNKNNSVKHSSSSSLTEE